MRPDDRHDADAKRWRPVVQLAGVAALALVAAAAVALLLMWAGRPAGDATAGTLPDTTPPGPVTDVHVCPPDCGVEPDPAPPVDPCVETVKGKRTFGCGVILFDGHGAEWWAREYRRLERRTKREARRDVHYALRLAAAAFGDGRAVDRPVTLAELRAVSRCESTWNPFSVNRSSGASGLFQFLGSTWRGSWGAQRFHALGFSVFDPVANALAAAQTVSRDGDWGQWVCKP